MGVGLLLTGRYGRGGIFSRPPAAADWLPEVESWLRSACSETLLSISRGQDERGQAALYLRLHPSAESVDLTIIGRGRLLVSAKTSTTGPGYHYCVSQFFQRLGVELGVKWDPPGAKGDTGDETGYFHTGDREAVEREMLAWLRAMARHTLDEPGGADGPNTWCLPIETRFDYDGIVGTPMGPRDIRWIEAVAADPSRGIDFFSWWEEGQGASYYLGRALSQMWTDVRWRPPSTDEETDLLVGIAGLLESAFRLDASLAYPWREWHEILGYLGADTPLAAEVARRAGQTPDGPKVGYRRRNVTVSLPGGWSIDVPGSLAESWDESPTWRVWDLTHTVRCSTFSMTKQNRAPTVEEVLSGLPLPESGEALQHQGKGTKGRAVINHVTDADGAYWCMTAGSVVPGELATTTICYEDSADRQWAIDTWHSLTHRSMQSD